MGTGVDAALAQARAAQRDWAAWPLRRQLGVIARARHAIARDPSPLLRTLAAKRPAADTIAAELLPLAAAARFLERAAPKLLAPRRLRGGRPLWLAGVAASIHRESLGVVLILGPSNFPLMLPGVQALQALAAGNAVCVKPAPGCSAPMAALRDALAAAGLPAGVLMILDESAATGVEAVRAGFDKIFLTGSAETGVRVLAAAAQTLTPATMELSGCDPAFVLPDADLDLVVDCLTYGLRLNAGATCIAPRRVFVLQAALAPLEAALSARMAALPCCALPAPTRRQLETALDEARVAGARVIGRSGDDGTGAVVVVHPSGAGRHDLRLLREDIFAPVLSLIPVASMTEALAIDRACPYALGASIFGSEEAARALIPRVRAGSVVVNDVIAPTADPRLPFGGRGRSGFGVTRGAEGLLEMTAVKAVSIRRGRMRPHLRPQTANDAALLQALLRLLHGRGWGRITAILDLIKSGRRTR